MRYKDEDMDPIAKHITARLKKGKSSHPLTIPGELLAEACELGRLVIQQVEDVWCAAILRAGYNAVEYASTPAEALQTAIAKAKDIN